MLKDASAFDFHILAEARLDELGSDVKHDVVNTQKLFERTNAEIDELYITVMSKQVLHPSAL